MRIIKALALCILAAAGGPRWAHAQTSAGAEPFEFLLLDANARAVGMGGAYTALAADANALLYNPAGLGFMKSHEATFMHNQFIEGLTQEYVGFAASQGWGLSLNYLDFGGVPRTTLSQPGGTGKRFGVSDTALGAGYGHRVFDSLSLGVGAKYIRETLDNVAVSAYALDGGILYRVPALAGLSFGAAIQNIGPDVQFQKAKENLPLNLRGGAAYAFSARGLDNTLAVDLTKTRTDKIRVSLGAETVIAKFMAVRAGLNSRNDADIGITAGLGWTWKALSFDYAFVPFGELGITNRVSLTFRWGGPPEQAAPKAGAEIPVPASPEEHFARAERLIEADSYEKAKEELEAAAALLGREDRRRVLYHERLGAVALRQNDAAAARASYTEGLRLAGTLGLSDPSVADAYAGMGRCLVAQDNIPYAIKFFKKALEAGPSPKTRGLVERELKRLRAANP